MFITSSVLTGLGLLAKSAAAAAAIAPLGVLDAAAGVLIITNAGARYIHRHGVPLGESQQAVDTD